MKTVKISEQAHIDLSIIRAQAHLRTLSDAIEWLINYRNTIIMEHKMTIEEYRQENKKLKENGNK